MSLPQDKFVAISSIVQSPAFTQEKKHMILAMDNSLITTSKPVLEFSGAVALNDFGAVFGSNIPEYTAVSKYFGYISKSGLAPDKVVIVRWYKENVAPFIKGSVINSLASLKAITDGSFTISLNDTKEEISGLDFSGATSYSDIATIIQTALHSKSGDAFINATVTYSSITKGFIITGGVAGLDNTISINQGTTGTDISSELGLIDGEVSDGVNAETFAELCDRIYNINPAGFAITTLEQVETEDIQNSIAWLNTLKSNQSINTKFKLVFNFNDKQTALSVAETLSPLNYTGYVITYDPYNEYINVLDCAIGASIDFEGENKAINFNFQTSNGYTPITNIDSPVDYQNGLTNLGIAAEFDNLKISYIYSVGVGSQQVICYGMGLMNGAFATEDVQINESWLAGDLKTAVMNGFIALEKVPAQGNEAVKTIDALVVPSYIKAVKNGIIAKGGTVSDNDKLTITKIFGANASNVITALENNGYYYQIQSITADDIKNKRARILSAYITSGVINQVIITNNIYGA